MVTWYTNTLNTQKLYILLTQCTKCFVFYGSRNKQRLLSNTALTDWFLEQRRKVFTARYKLDLQIKEFTLCLLRFKHDSKEVFLLTEFFFLFKKFSSDVTYLSWTGHVTNHRMKSFYNSNSTVLCTYLTWYIGGFCCSLLQFHKQSDVYSWFNFLLPSMIAARYEKIFRKKIYCYALCQCTERG